MQKLVLLAMAIACTAGAADVAAAQGSPAIDSAVTARAKLPMPIDAWITRPDTIKLSPDQQKQFDDIRAKMVDEFVRLTFAVNGDRDAIKAKFAEPTTRFQALVKAILTPAQQVVLAKNIAAPPPKKGGE